MEWREGSLKIKRAAAERRRWSQHYLLGHTLRCDELPGCPSAAAAAASSREVRLRGSVTAARAVVRGIVNTSSKFPQRKNLKSSTCSTLVTPRGHLHRDTGMMDPRKSGSVARWRASERPGSMQLS